MATITLRNGEVQVRFSAWNVLHTLRRRIVVPFRRVVAVRVHPKEADFDGVVIEGWRGFGTYVPRRYAMGVVHLKDGPAFFEVRDMHRVIAIDLLPSDVLGYTVRKVVVQVDRESPESAASRIERAIERHFGLTQGLSAVPSMPPKAAAEGDSDEELVAAASVKLGRRAGVT
jgi:hypothetical protein